MENDTGRTAGDRAEGLRPIHEKKQLRQGRAEEFTSQNGPPDDLGGATGIGGAAKSLIQMWTYTLANIAEGRTPTDRGGSGICGAQK